MNHHPPTRIVFVTGASRSGTTVLSRMLGNHSRIAGLRELHYFGDLCPADPAAPLDDREIERLAAAIFARQARDYWGGGPAQPDRDRARQLRESLAPGERSGYGVFSAALALLAADTGKNIACEQTPRNIFYAPSILKHLPAASFVHIVRDPRAVLASQKNRWKIRTLGARQVPLRDAIRTWANYHPLTMARLWVSATNAALRLVEDPRFKLVRFEDLLATPDQCMREICEFIDVPFEPEMLEVPKWGSSNVKAESGSTGLSKDVLHQWEAVLGAGEIAIVEQMANGLMSHFSYEARTSAALPGRRTLRHKLSYPLHLLGVALTNPRRAVIQVRAMLGNNGHR